MKRYSRKTLVAVIIFVAMFISWYVSATYKEYDFWTGVGRRYEKWQLIREIEIVNWNGIKFNISMTMNMALPGLTEGVNITTMTWTINRTYENGTTFYRQVDVLADAEFEELYRFRDLLGHRLS